MMEKNQYPKSRVQAKELGLIYYYNGKPCKFARHDCLRYTSTGKCADCHKSFYNKNKESISKRGFVYRERTKTERSVAWKKWYKENKEKHKKRSKEYYFNNLEKAKITQRKHYEKTQEKRKRYSKEWAAKNKERVNNNLKRWQSENYEKVRNYKRNCDAKRRKALGNHTSQDILNLYKQQKAKCVNCMCNIKEKYHVDHIMPLSLGGSNNAKNLQLLCPSCNCKKHAKHPIDWALENGRLV